jgi:arylsulfatase A-like enzyme
MFARWEDRQRPLDALPTRFARAGYATKVISDFAGDSFPLADFGFDRVEAPRLHFRNLIRSRAFARETVLFPFLSTGLGRRLFPAMTMHGDSADPEILADAAVETLREQRGRPFFLTVFFSSPHFPYAAPAPHYRTFTSSAYRGRFKYRKDAGFTSLDPESVEQVRGLYDGAVASVDAASGRILDALDRLGLAESTIVVITGDHGEALFESGRWHGHGDNLFGDEPNHVPLAIVDPRRAPGGARAEIVRDVDLAPTLYALAGVAPPPDLDGRSLAPALAGAPLAPAFAFGETELWLGDSPVIRAEQRIPYPGLLGLLEIDDRHGDDVVLKLPYPRVTVTARHRSIRDDRFKLVYMPTPTGPGYRFFDTAADPGETRDASAEHPAQRARLEAALWRWILLDPTVVERDGMVVDR